MLKELFTFHSKEEDHRVMCLILVLLGVSLLINPANAWTELASHNWAYTSGYTAWNTNGFTVANLSAFSRDVTKIEVSVEGNWQNTSMAHTGSETYTIDCDGGAKDGNATISWSMDGDHVSWVPLDITIEILDMTDKVSTSSAACNFEGNRVAGFNPMTMFTGYFHNSAGTGWPSNKYEFMFNAPTGYATEDSIIYGGSEAPDAPVINDFTKDATCYAPGEAMVLESNITGSVDSWLWEIYDSSDVQQWSSTDSVETIVDHVFSPGLYQAQLYVENTGGSDFLSKDNWINVTQAGGCGPVGNWTNPFPTTTITPSETLFPVVTVPQMANWNMTGVNDLINQSSLGNASIGYRQYWDKMAEQVNTTLLGTVYVVVSPFTTIVSAVSNGLTLFSTAYTSIIGYTTVPLQVVSIAISAMPWQIISLITAGIAIDAILIIVLGVR